MKKSFFVLSVMLIVCALYAFAFPFLLLVTVYAGYHQIVIAVLFAVFALMMTGLGIAAGFSIGKRWFAPAIPSVVCLFPLLFPSVAEAVFPLSGFTSPGALVCGMAGMVLTALCRRAVSGRKGTSKSPLAGGGGVIFF